MTVIKIPDEQAAAGSRGWPSRKLLPISCSAQTAAARIRDTQKRSKPDPEAGRFTITSTAVVAKWLPS